MILILIFNLVSALLYSSLKRDFRLIPNTFPPLIFVILLLIFNLVSTLIYIFHTILMKHLNPSFLYCVETTKGLTRLPYSTLFPPLYFDKSPWYLYWFLTSTVFNYTFLLIFYEVFASFLARVAIGNVLWLNKTRTLLYFL